jgi:hypothetical protein
LPDIFRNKGNPNRKIQFSGKSCLIKEKIIILLQGPHKEWDKVKQREFVKPIPKHPGRG